MTKKVLRKVDFAFLNCKNADQKNFKKEFKMWLKQLQIYYFKLSIMFSLLLLFFSIFSFFSISSILASIIVFKSISYDYLFILKKSLDFNTIFYILWKGVFIIIIFLLMNIFIFIKIIQIYQFKKNINKNKMFNAINMFCQIKILPQNFSIWKKTARLSLLLINTALILSCATSLPIPNNLIKYEIDYSTHKEIIYKIEKYM